MENKKTLQDILQSQKRDDSVLQVNDLHISFKTDDGLVQAVRGVSFDLYKGETLCIVGESGSGKSVTSKTIMGILPSTAIIEKGSILFEGEDLTKIDESEFHRIRGHKIGMIFQDPLSSLNPIMRVGKQITEAMLVNKNHLKKMKNEKISEQLAAYKNEKVKLKEVFSITDVLCDDNTQAFVKESARLNKIVESEAYALSLIDKDDEKYPQEKEKYLSLKKETKDKIKQLEIDLKKDNAKIKNDRKEIEEQAKKTYKTNIPTLKLQLKEAKKKANSEIKEFVFDSINQYKTDRKNLNDQLKEIQFDKEKLIDENLNKEKEEKKTFKDNLIYILHVIKHFFVNLKVRYDFYKDKFLQRYDCFQTMMSKFRLSKKEAKEKALKVMKEVGIPQPEQRFKQYPFEFSGGMRQRIVIAIALTADPDILICDEPTTALDVTIQAQILELINQLKAQRHMSIIFITHDLGVVANMADRVAVMYAGKIVEVGTSNEIFYDPKHPYTWALLSSIPDLDSKEKLEAIQGTPPYLLNPPIGDAFAARNKYALAIDFEAQPPFFKVSETHYAATWLLDGRAPKTIKPKIVTARIEKSLEKAGVMYDK